jgi:hypothetical protein
MFSDVPMVRRTLLARAVADDELRSEMWNKSDC